MDISALRPKLIRLGKKAAKNENRALTLMGLGAFLAGIGVLASLLLARGDYRGMEIISVQPTARPSEIMVDVGGAVQRPGLYKLFPGARLADALAAAGGLAASADRDLLSKSFNLAQKVTDGSKIYVPAVGETAAGSLGFSSSAPAANSYSVSINNAAAAELETLWGIGPSRAQAIISGRPYSGIEELVERGIIPPNVFERNQGKLEL